MTKKSVFDSPDVDTSFTPPQRPDQLCDPHTLVTNDNRRWKEEAGGLRSPFIRATATAAAAAAAALRKRATVRLATSTARSLPDMLLNFTLSTRR
jgi:hypothetical protein